MGKARNKGYGVLRRDGHLRTTIVEFRQVIETRLCVPNPLGDGSALTLVTRLRENGTYEVIVEDSQQKARKSLIGNIYTDTQ